MFENHVQLIVIISLMWPLVVHTFLLVILLDSELILQFKLVIEMENLKLYFRFNEPSAIPYSNNSLPVSVANAGALNNSTTKSLTAS